MKNTTYQYSRLIIEHNRYEYSDMFAKLDLFLLVGRITEEEYIELTGMLVAPEHEPEPTPEPDPLPDEPVTPPEKETDDPAKTE